MSLLAPYKELAALIPAQFDKAKASGALNSYPSTTELVTEDGQDVSQLDLLPLDLYTRVPSLSPALADSDLFVLSSV